MMYNKVLDPALCRVLVLTPEIDAIFLFLMTHLRSYSNIFETET